MGVSSTWIQGPLIICALIEELRAQVNLFVDHSEIEQLECLRSGIWETKNLWGRDVLYRTSQALSFAIYSVCIVTSWVPPEFVGTWISSPRFVLTIWNAAGELFSRTDLIWVLTGKVYPMVKLQPAGAETVVT